MEFSTSSTTLSSTFHQLYYRYTTDTELIEQYYQELVEYYTAPSRYYHTFTHLNLMLQEMQRIKDTFQDWDAALFALFYHDVIYNPSRKDNEEQSAVLAQARLKAIACPSERIVQVEAHIVATKNHNQSLNLDTNLFTDADISILGQNWNHYHKYTQAIRKEYAIYTDEQYVKGRKEVLHHFLKMTPIFKTTYFRKLYEEKANENIKQELLYSIE